MKLFDYLSALGQSSYERNEAEKIYDIMLNYHLTLAIEQAEKMAKAKAQIAETGKTKLSWDESVLAKNFVWSTDVMSAEYKIDRPTVVLAFKHLEAEGKVKRLFLSGQPSQCVWIPVSEVIKHV